MEHQVKEERRAGPGTMVDEHRYDDGRKILRAKEWVQSEGSYPSRVVLVKWDETTVSTHNEVDGTKDNLGFYIIWGHYFYAQEREDYLTAAAEDFESREV